MERQRRIRTVSKATRALLLQGESELADFKRAPSGVSADDLVAFANTELGGTILVGVDERTSADGTQRGVIRGCDVSDAAILQILNKAVSCVPPVGVVVHVENSNAKPILRVVVPSSESKPHCTSKGVYCCRDGSRNRPLHPGELLKIFLDTEGRAFADRFESAANRIKRDLRNLEGTLEDSISSMGDQLGWAEYKLGDTESTLDSILSYVLNTRRQTADLATRLRTLFRQDNREDPVRQRVRQEFLEAVVKQFTDDPALLGKMRGAFSFTVSGEPAVELNEEEIKDVVTKAAEVVTERNETKKYSAEVKPPAKATTGELDEFTALVAAGGEVADGLRQRLKKASALGLLRYEDRIIGTAALKKPNEGYRKKVFESAGSGRGADDFPLELGWIYLDAAHRGKKRILPLIDAVLERAKKTGVFATARTANEKMTGILTRYGFVREGFPYASEQRPDEELALFLRLPERPAKKSTEAA